MSDKADVAVSYDIDNEFFRLWLDKRMSYTCAVFDDTDDLDEAQQAKLGVMYDFARVTSASRVLDIGCGWGANLEYLVHDRNVAEVHGITLSEAQHAEIVRRGLPRVTASCVDYADYRPGVRFDAIISICMIEHLCSAEDFREGRAAAKYADYFRRAWEWAEPGTHFGLQTILRDRVPRAREDIREIRWVSRKIFPGGLAPRPEDIMSAAAPYWEVKQMRTRRTDYQRTCAEWQARLRRNEALVRQRWGNQLFTDYDRYLTGCVNGFARRHMSLAQWSLQRIDDAA
ncbi:class I SAM-dependent methyltransferase [Streptomyces sp. NPDC127068]|uniref:class I SAM-dependent methyltransferase n=1 Tax=Streptomyces sp. NPDC127068 TaxID=3347127 RepID=UPI0036541024